MPRFVLSAHPPSYVVLVLMGCLQVGCAAPRQLPSEPPPRPTAIQQLAAGAVVAVRRPTPGVALLSVWIAAGSRDASVPQLATAAAWWAAAQAGVHGRVLPHGTQLSLLCNTRRDELAHCSERLMQAFSPRSAVPADSVELRARLRATRLHALSYSARQVEQRALRALLGAAQAAAFQPLGQEPDDAKVTAEAVNQFIASHYRRSQAVLVAAGDVDPGVLRQHWDAAPTGSLPPQAAGNAPAAPAAVGGLSVELGPDTWIALSLAVPDARLASSLGQRFRAIHPETSAHVSSLRGLHVLHLRLPGGRKPLARLRSAVFNLRRLSMEPPTSPVEPEGESLEAIVRGIGERWAGRGDRADLAQPWPLGIAVSLRAKDAAAADQAPELSAATEAVKLAVEAGEQASQPRLTGRQSELEADVTTENGARIRALRRPGDKWFAAAIRLQGGSAQDPPSRHGRAALLATLMADSCGFAQDRGLDSWLSMLGAHLTPIVDAEGVGLRISAPAYYAEEALDTLLRCALRPALSSRTVDDARLRLTRWHAARRSLQLQRTLARVVAPVAPGTVAPWGAASGIAKVEVGELQRFHGQSAAGSRIALWIAGDRGPGELARFAARRLAQLPSQARPWPASEAGSPVPLGGALVRAGKRHVVIGVRAPSPGRGSLGARAFAQALAEGLGARVGRPEWHWGGSSAELAAAGVSLLVSEDEIGEIRARCKQVMQELAGRSDDGWLALLEPLAMARAAALSHARDYVEAAFYGTADAPHASDADIALARRLSLAAPNFFITRPRP